ncbi:hypothetical protein H6F89_04105 [Cyanobacteria bacterium FACHB-63]|nr:hypothetical protein [Cyanobacteria bacterium FACHB-63]
MPRPKKNPVTEMPVVEVMPDPEHSGAANVQNPGPFDTAPTPTQRNVIPINRSVPASVHQDWSEIDAVLSDVVSFI